MAQRNFKPRHRNTPAAGRTFNGRKDIENMYDWAWRKYCDKYLNINPECFACGGKSEVVDHLIPHKGEERLFKKTDNMIPLCSKCHNTVTGLFDTRYVPGNPITAKLKWLHRNRNKGGEWKRVKVVPWS